MSLRQSLEGLLEGYHLYKSPKSKHFSSVNTILVIINVLVFIFLEIGGDTEDAYYMLTRGAMFVPLMVENGEYYRLFTSMFLHFGINHLTGNMISLLFLGDNLERALGKIKYLVLYLVSGLGASACSFAYNYIKGENVVAAGASGAVFGVIGALFYTLIRNKGKLEDLTSMRLGILIVYILYSGFVSSGIDNAAHIGGLLIGFLLAIPLYPKRKMKQRRKEMGRAV
ncbi:MAG: rhomboid family intramembrane serine protease [Clostridiales bacterium]|nr:rhomboid family intramembrane serine protease [Clostridiales bacterium]